MSHEVKTHEAQTKILRELLFAQSINFAKLVKATELEADHAKFHIKRLVELAYIEKIGKNYKLSIIGKEHANKLYTDNNTIERQPKSACLLTIKNSKTGKFLIQKRLKNPFFGFLAFPTGKIRWGETISEAATREAEEESGLKTAPKDWQWRGICHEIVRYAHSDKIIEDKIFYVMFTDRYSGEMIKDFEGGRNKWMTLDELFNSPKHFETARIMADGAEKNIGLVEVSTEYGDEF